MKELTGILDLHVHSAPDVMKRSIDDVALAARIAGSPQQDGYVIKSHYFCTAERAELVSGLYDGCRVYGGLVLNQSVGGLNKNAVELAARAGARIVWFPTCDAFHEKASVENPAISPAKKAAWARIRLAIQEKTDVPYLRILEEDGSFAPGVTEVLDAIARNSLTLATGHISPMESMALVREARARGIQKILVTHATFPSTFFTIEQQRELVGLGAIIEHCYTTYSTGKVSLDTMVEHIRAVGPENVLLSTDLGQPGRPFPDEGMLLFADDLRQRGFENSQLRKMMADNPRALLGL